MIIVFVAFPLTHKHHLFCNIKRAWLLHPLNNKYDITKLWYNWNNSNCMYFSCSFSTLPPLSPLSIPLFLLFPPLSLFPTSYHLSLSDWLMVFLFLLLFQSCSCHFTLILSKLYFASPPPLVTLFCLLLFLSAFHPCLLAFFIISLATFFLLPLPPLCFNPRPRSYYCRVKFW